MLEKTESGPILATISNNHRESGNAGTHNIVPWTSRGLEGYTCEHRGKHLKTQGIGAAEVTEIVRALAALAEDWVQFWAPT